MKSFKSEDASEKRNLTKCLNIDENHFVTCATDETLDFTRKASNLLSKSKDSGFESGCQLCTKVSSLQQSPG